MRYHIPVIPALGKQRQEDIQWQASLDYIVKPYLKGKRKTRKAIVKLLGKPKNSAT